MDNIKSTDTPTTLDGVAHGCEGRLPRGRRYKHYGPSGWCLQGKTW